MPRAARCERVTPTIKSLRLLAASSKTLVIVIAPFGQASSQRPQNTQEARSNCHLTPEEVRLMVMALDGQLLAQAPEQSQREGSICGFARGYSCVDSFGYGRVTRPVRKLARNMFSICYPPLNP